jgi:hypothetical protein
VSITIEVRGGRRLSARITRIVGQVDGVHRAVALGAEDIKGEAVRMIQKGARSGRVYDTYFWTDSQGRLRKGRKRNRPHQASAPGEPPKTDSGRLVSHIFSRIAGRAVAEAGTDIRHGIYLEHGTAKMAPRPWLSVALKRRREAIMERIRRAVSAALRT